MFSRTILSCRIHELLHVPSRLNVPKYKKCQSQYHDPQENINQVQAKQRVYHDQMATIQTSQDQLLEILFHLATIH